MDQILSFLKKIYSFVYNQPTNVDGVPVTQIYASKSNPTIGLPINTLKEIVINVFGNNTLTIQYGDKQILDVIPVPEGKNILEKIFTEIIKKEFIKYEKGKDVEHIKDSPEKNYIESQYNVIKEVLASGSLPKLPYRVKTINPPKNINPVKPIKPVRKIKPVKNIPRP